MHPSISKQTYLVGEFAENLLSLSVLRKSSMQGGALLRNF